MKILWFVNRFFPDVSDHLGMEYQANGHWMAALGGILAKQNGIELAVATVSSAFEKYEKYQKDGVTYYCLPVDFGNIYNGFGRKIISYILNIFPLSQKSDLGACKRVVNDFLPDVVHFHGAEPFYALMASSIKQPTIVSIQGILTEYLKDFWGATPWFHRFLLPAEIYRYLNMKRKAKRERVIYRRNKYFIGRTNWDKNHLFELNPNGRYYYCNEVIRPIFSEVRWDLDNVSRHVVYTTTTCLPYKGTRCLLEAISLICSKLPNLKVRIGGPITTKGYGKYLRNSVKELGIENKVNFLGILNESQIAQELIQAHVFVLPSFIENSPNTLAEAQLVGVPCIAAYVGGVPSMILENQTGLLFPKGDVAVLTGCIEKIFKDDVLARSLSRNAHEAASNRHDAQNITENMVSIYDNVIEKSGKVDSVG